jgi:hypothetical protein
MKHHSLYIRQLGDNEPRQSMAPYADLVSEYVSNDSQALFSISPKVQNSRTRTGNKTNLASSSRNGRGKGELGELGANGALDHSPSPETAVAMTSAPATSLRIYLQPRSSIGAQFMVRKCNLTLPGPQT